MSGIIKEHHACSEEGLGERNHQETKKTVKEKHWGGRDSVGGAKLR